MTDVQNQVNIPLARRNGGRHVGSFEPRISRSHIDELLVLYSTDTPSLSPPANLCAPLSRTSLDENPQVACNAYPRAPIFATRSRLDRSKVDNDRRLIRFPQNDVPGVDVVMH